MATQLFQKKKQNFGAKRQKQKKVGREKKSDFLTQRLGSNKCACMCVCVYLRVCVSEREVVCVYERERERVRECV